MKPDKIKWILVTIALFSCIIFGLFWWIRNQLIHSILPTKIQSIEQKTGYKISYSDASLDGLYGIRFVSLQIQNANLRVSGHQLNIQLSPLSLLFGNISIQTLRIDSLFIHHAVSEVTTQPDSIAPIEWTVFFQRQFQRVETILAKVPPNIEIPLLRFQTNSQDSTQIIEFRSILSDNQKLTADCYWQPEKNNQSAKIRLNFASDKIDLTIVAPPKQEFGFSRKQTAFHFQELNLQSAWKNSSHATHCNGSIMVQGLKVLHKRLSKQEVSFPPTKIDFGLILENRFVEIDSATQIQLGDLPISVYLKADWKNQDTIIEVNSSIPNLAAATYLSAIPEKFCSRLKELELDGFWQWNFRLKMNLSKPEEDELIAELKSNGIKIKKNPYPYLLALDSAFTYQPYNANRTLRMGKGSSTFTPLDSISQTLRNCV
ncbi:MAG: AsmA family protein, partial [Bacteroidia bacterium]|nr:AsmA family protein [Bacteroidia bacterium]